MRRSQLFRKCLGLNPPSYASDTLAEAAEDVLCSAAGDVLSLAAAVLR